jgi:hypothetical protein
LPAIGKSPIRNTRISYYYDIGMTMRRNYNTIVKEFNYSKNVDNYLKLCRYVATHLLFISWVIITGNYGPFLCKQRWYEHSRVAVSPINKIDEIGMKTYSVELGRKFAKPGRAAQIAVGCYFF